MPFALILTDLPEAYLTVRSYLKNLQEQVDLQGNVYETGKFFTSFHNWDVGISEIGSDDTETAAKTERAISQFSPDILILVGIINGLSEVSVGDIVVANKVYSYESGKIKDEFLVRPELGKSAHALVERARVEARKDAWKERLATETATLSRVFIAPIASGYKAITSKNSQLCGFIDKNYNDAVALEMGSFGFLNAAFAYSNIKAVVIQGIYNVISDSPRKDNFKSEISRKQQAAAHASAFSFEILSKLTFPIIEIDSARAPLSQSNSSAGIIGKQIESEKTYEDFVGRNDEVKQIIAQLESNPSNRVISLVGLGGIGKTALCHYITSNSEFRLKDRVSCLSEPSRAA